MLPGDESKVLKWECFCQVYLCTPSKTPKCLPRDVKTNDQHFKGPRRSGMALHLTANFPLFSVLCLHEPFSFWNMTCFFLPQAWCICGFFCPKWSPSHPQLNLNTRMFLDTTHSIICSYSITESSFLPLASSVHLHSFTRCLDDYQPPTRRQVAWERHFVPPCIPALSTTLGI